MLASCPISSVGKSFRIKSASSLVILFWLKIFFNIDQIKEASMVSDISYVQLPVNILNNPLSSAYSNFCKENSIRIVAYNALARGLLSGKYQEGTTFSENDSCFVNFNSTNLKIIKD